MRKSILLFVLSLFFSGSSYCENLIDQIANKFIRIKSNQTEQYIAAYDEVHHLKADVVKQAASQDLYNTVFFVNKISDTQIKIFSGTYGGKYLSGNPLSATGEIKFAPDSKNADWSLEGATLDNVLIKFVLNGNYLKVDSEKILTTRDLNLPEISQAKSQRFSIEIATEIGDFSYLNGQVFRIKSLTSEKYCQAKNQTLSADYPAVKDASFAKESMFEIQLINGDLVSLKNLKTDSYMGIDQEGKIGFKNVIVGDAEKWQLRSHGISKPNTPATRNVTIKSFYNNKFIEADATGIVTLNEIISEKQAFSIEGSTAPIADQIEDKTFRILIENKYLSSIHPYRKHNPVSTKHQLKALSNSKSGAAIFKIKKIPNTNYVKIYRANYENSLLQSYKAAKSYCKAYDAVLNDKFKKEDGTYWILEGSGERDGNKIKDCYIKNKLTGRYLAQDDEKENVIRGIGTKKSPDYAFTIEFYDPKDTLVSKLKGKTFWIKTKKTKESDPDKYYTPAPSLRFSGKPLNHRLRLTKRSQAEAEQFEAIKPSEDSNYFALKRISTGELFYVLGEDRTGVAYKHEVLSYGPTSEKLGLTKSTDYRTGWMIDGDGEPEGDRFDSCYLKSYTRQFYLTPVDTKDKLEGRAEKRREEATLVTIEVNDQPYDLLEKLEEKTFWIKSKKTDRYLTPKPPTLTRFNKNNLRLSPITDVRDNAEKFKIARLAPDSPVFLLQRAKDGNHVRALSLFTAYIGNTDDIVIPTGKPALKAKTAVKKQQRVSGQKRWTLVGSSLDNCYLMSYMNKKLLTIPEGYTKGRKRIQESRTLDHFPTDASALSIEIDEGKTIIEQLDGKVVTIKDTESKMFFVVIDPISKRWKTNKRIRALVGNEANASKFIIERVGKTDNFRIKTPDGKALRTIKVLPRKTIKVKAGVGRQYDLYLGPTSGNEALWSIEGTLDRCHLKNKATSRYLSRWKQWHNVARAVNKKATTENRLEINIIE